MTPTFVIVFIFFILFLSISGSAFEKAKSWSLFWRTLVTHVRSTVFLNFAEKSKAILFCEISGFSFRWFKTQIFSSTESRTLFFIIGIIFTVYQNLVNDESSFFNPKIIFRNNKQKSNSNTRIDTFNAKSSRVPK